MKLIKQSGATNITAIFDKENKTLTRDGVRGIGRHGDAPRDYYLFEKYSNFNSKVSELKRMGFVEQTT